MPLVLDLSPSDEVVLSSCYLAILYCICFCLVMDGEELVTMEFVVDWNTMSFDWRIEDGTR